jgi:chemotaxis protein methyltransferase CheR
MTEHALRPGELPQWISYLYELTGMQLDASKSYLIVTRLGMLAQELGYRTLSDLLRAARTDATRAIAQKIIDAITTHETSFFRDTAPFDLLRHKLFPEALERRLQPGAPRQPITVWCAACSTGQEVYSIGMIWKELVGDAARVELRIVGTDIAGSTIAQAEQGVYSQLEIERGLTPEQRQRHFEQRAGQWHVRRELRALASFSTMNLLQPFRFPYKFDIIFCRNVAIYFSEADRITLYAGISDALARDGSLIIGSTESLTGLCPQFVARRHRHAVYYQLRGPV